MDKKGILEALIAHYTGGNKSQFAKMLGVKPQTINTWDSRSTFDIELIYSKCEHISADWLLTGEGPMLKTSTSSAHEAPCPDEKERKTEKNGEKQRRSEKIENILLESISCRREALREFHSYQLAQWQEHSLPTCL